jgi:hypothetical protein
MSEGSLPGADDPELAVLGHAFHDELRAEAEADEALAAKHLLRRRGLADVALELLHRGDRVTAAVAGMSFTGIVRYAAGDLACLRTARTEVDLRLSAGVVLRVVEPVRGGGQPRGRGPASFVARLHEHEAGGRAVELGGPALPGGLAGRIEAVGGDHLVLTEPDGRRAYVGLVAVAYVHPLRG